MSANSSGQYPPVPWHTLDIDQTLEKLQVDPATGLTTAEALGRLQQYGPNELKETAGRSPWMILLDQFKNIMLLMLIGVAFISGFLAIQQREFPKDAVAIMLIVILNGVLGYLQETKAEKALAALKSLASPLVRVLRDGKLLEVAATAVVPGDLMFLEAGVQVAADAKLLEESNLQIRESALTGEAQAVEKDALIQLPENTPLGDRLNLVFCGTEVVKGRAKAIVTGTGMHTELGKIATLIQGVESEDTPLQQRMTQLGNVLVTGSLVLVAIVVIGGTLVQGMSAFNHLLEISLSMAVAIVPEGLPAVITVTLALGTQRMVKRHALIRKLPAVETLGSVTTICSDKTGTLTQNKMVVQGVETLSHSLTVTGEGYQPTGDFLGANGTKIGVGELGDYPELETLLLSCVQCNDAVLQYEKQDWAIVGDPTEGALLALAGKLEFTGDRLSPQLPRISEFPFSSERKRMSVICQVSNPESEVLSQDSMPFVMFTKGSPELTLDCCTQILIGKQIQPLSEAQRQQVLDRNNNLAARGLRVLGFAYKPLTEEPPESSEDQTEQELVWLGLVGMLDAPRPEVREAVVKCRKA
ncbi:MAG: cation-translocating P-type ATPase, partial [Chroococcales cyanobacterium]